MYHDSSVLMMPSVKAEDSPSDHFLSYDNLCLNGHSSSTGSEFANNNFKTFNNNNNEYFNNNNLANVVDVVMDASSFNDMTPSPDVLLDDILASSPSLSGVNGSLLLEPGNSSRRLGSGTTGSSGSRRKAHNCSSCSAIFSSKMELEEHQNSHTGEKPFECDVCQARFNRRSTLWNHKRIHSDTKPFTCPVCSLTFKWKNSLKCHKEMHLRKNETGSFGVEGMDAAFAVSSRRGRHPAKRGLRKGGGTIGGKTRAPDGEANVVEMTDSSFLGTDATGSLVMNSEETGGSYIGACSGAVSCSLRHSVNGLLNSQSTDGFPPDVYKIHGDSATSRNVQSEIDPLYGTSSSDRPFGANATSFMHVDFCSKDTAVLGEGPAIISGPYMGPNGTVQNYVKDSLDNSIKGFAYHETSEYSRSGSDRDSSVAGASFQTSPSMSNLSIDVFPPGGSVPSCFDVHRPRYHAANGLSNLKGHEMSCDYTASQPLNGMAAHEASNESAFSRDKSPPPGINPYTEKPDSQSFALGGTPAEVILSCYDVGGHAHSIGLEHPTTAIRNSTVMVSTNDQSSASGSLGIPNMAAAVRPQSTSPFMHLGTSLPSTIPGSVLLERTSGATNGSVALSFKYVDPAASTPDTDFTNAVGAHLVAQDCTDAIASPTGISPAVYSVVSRHLSLPSVTTPTTAVTRQQTCVSNLFAPHSDYLPNVDMLYGDAHQPGYLAQQQSTGAMDFMGTNIKSKSEETDSVPPLLYGVVGQSEGARANPAFTMENGYMVRELTFNEW